MKTQVKVYIKAWLSLMFLILVGCSVQNSNFLHLMPLNEPPQIRGDLGPIAIVSAEFTPESNYPKNISTGEAATTGVVWGVAEGVKAGLLAPLQNPLFILVLPIAVGVGAAAGALFGGIYGPLVAPSNEKTEMAKAAIIDAIEDFKIQETMRNQIISKTREQTQYELIFVQDQAPMALDESVNYLPLTAKGIKTVLEISVRRYGFWVKEDSNAPSSSALNSTFNPRLSFFMTVSTRLIRVRDGEVLHSETFRYERGQRKFVEWGANNAQPFREELDLCSQYLTTKIVKEVFFLRAPIEDRHGTGLTSEAQWVEEACEDKFPFGQEHQVTDGVLVATDDKVSFLTWDGKSYETLLEFGYDKITDVEVKGRGRSKWMLIFADSGNCFTFQLIKKRTTSVIWGPAIWFDSKATVEMVDFISKKVKPK
jgi:hypothetical protein